MTRHLSTRPSTYVRHSSRCFIPRLAYVLHPPYLPLSLSLSQVLYTYLNVPFLELKRKSLLQQAEIAAERLEKEYQELAGFIGGHSYGNYMQHLRSSDVDPTAGACCGQCVSFLLLGFVLGLVLVVVMNELALVLLVAGSVAWFASAPARFDCSRDFIRQTARMSGHRLLRCRAEQSEPKARQLFPSGTQNFKISRSAALIAVLLFPFVLPTFLRRPIGARGSPGASFHRLHAGGG